MNTEKEIFAAIRLGDDNKAFGLLYKRCLAKVKNYIIKNGGTEEEAKDIFQDSIIIFYQQVKMKKFDESKDPDGFIYTVGRNLWINRTKKLGRYTGMEMASGHEPGEEIVDTILEEQNRELINKVFSTLGEKCKELLLHVFYNNLSMKEVAEKMGFSGEDVAKSSHYRCKQKMLELVKVNPSIKTLFKH